LLYQKNKIMKVTKITYWTTTILLAAMMVFSAFGYLTQEAIKQGFQHLGFPDYFRVELAIAKLAGAVVLLAPVASRLKEWAYAGFTITFISAFIAHTASGDPVFVRMMPLLFLVLLAVSYVAYHKRQTAGQQAPDTWQVVS
jgi:hypothetical protein